MSDEEVRFSAEDVILIASKLTVENDTFVIGGQATNLWAWLYQDRHPALSSEESFTSKDIDYYGSSKSANAFAEALGGKVMRPSADRMNSPNTAVVETVVNGKPLRIDFLNTVIGVRKHLADNVSVVSATARTLDGKEVVAEISVMHPVNCLKSRIGNMLSPATMRRDALAYRQLHAALAILEVYIGDALAEGDIREATDCFRDIFEYLRSDEYGKRAESDLDINVVGILEAFAEDERLDPRYREMTLTPMIATVRGKRQSRDERLKRNRD